MKEKVIQKSLVQSIDNNSPVFKNYISLRQLFGEYLKKLHVPFVDNCCTAAQIPNILPLAQNADEEIVVYKDGEWQVVPTGGGGGEELTFSEGLTKGGVNVVLGGIISDEALLSLETYPQFQLKFNNPGNEFFVRSAPNFGLWLQVVEVGGEGEQIYGVTIGEDYSGDKNIRVGSTHVGIHNVSIQNDTVDFGNYDLTAFGPKKRHIIADNYILTAADSGQVLFIKSAGDEPGEGIVVYLPVGLPENFACTIVQEGQSRLYVVGDGTNVFNSDNLTTSKSRYSIVTILTMTPNNFVVGGDVA